MRCPALDTEVHFTSDGFNHLLHKPNRLPRARKEQKNKLSCLKEAVEIIKRSTTVQEYWEEMQTVGSPDKSGFKKTAKVKYFIFIALWDHNGIMKRVKVVVRKVGDGQFHFWSVMPYWLEQEVSDDSYIILFGKRTSKDE